MKKLAFVFCAVLVAFCLYSSVRFATISSTRDFADFYYGSCVVTDPSLPNSAVYDEGIIPSTYAKYGITKEPDVYNYSILAAFLMSPLTMLSYETAKIAWNVLNVVMYLAAIIIILRHGRISGVMFYALLSAPLLWVPMYFNQYWLQSNPLMLFMITLAVLAATKNRPCFSGLILAVSALFKLYPIAIALILALKNWRIIVAFAVAFGLSMLIPGSTEWLTQIREFRHPNYTTAYNLLGGSYYTYVAVVAGITALAAWRNRSGDYAMLTSIAIPAALLTSPVVGGYYLVIVIYTYIYLFTLEIPKWFMILLAGSFCLTNFTAIIYDKYTVGLLVLWGLLIFKLLVMTKIIDTYTLSVNGDTVADPVTITAKQ